MGQQISLHRLEVFFAMAREASAPILDERCTAAAAAAAANEEEREF